jgi:uncharacterized protein YPO0396
VDYIFCAAYLAANNLRRISTTYLRGYWKGSENGRVVTIDQTGTGNKKKSSKTVIVNNSININEKVVSTLSDLKQLNTKRPRHGLIEIHTLV